MHKVNGELLIDDAINVANLSDLLENVNECSSLLFLLILYISNFKMVLMWKHRNQYGIVS